MKPVRYPTDNVERSALKQRYVKALAVLKKKDGTNRLHWCNKEWKKIRHQLPQGNRFPSDVRKILTAEFPKLVIYYKYYVQNPLFSDRLSEVFSYDIFHDCIASFFMDGRNGFDLRVCHYCGMAYINKYTVRNKTDGLAIINSASIKELEKLLKIKTPSTLSFIIKNRPYGSVAQFNSLSVFRCPDKFHSVFPESKEKNHFDLDHVLDKGSCPIEAISLMNLVPSCSVCNEKLKGSQLLGYSGIPDVELSPTSQAFNFDGNVDFVLLPLPGRRITNRPTKHEDDYHLEMSVKKQNYERFIEVFHLRERYGFHIMEALFWLEMKYRYTDSRIAMMANALHNTEFSHRRIKEDIFQLQLDNKERCFEKLKRDMLK